MFCESLVTAPTRSKERWISYTSCRFVTIGQAYYPSTDILTPGFPLYRTATTLRERGLAWLLVARTTALLAVRARSFGLGLASDALCGGTTATTYHAKVFDVIQSAGILPDRGCTERTALGALPKTATGLTSSASEVVEVAGFLLIKLAHGERAQ